MCNQDECNQDECKKKAMNNNEGFNDESCHSCKEPKMVNVKRKPCIYPDCKTRPHYNKEGEKRHYIVQHTKVKE